MLAFVLADDGVLEVLTGRVEPGVLAVLVGLEGDHVAAQLVQLELGVVQPLRGLLGLVEEGVDARLHVVDVGLCLGRRRGDQPDHADSGGQGQPREGRGQSLPSVNHEAEVSLLLSYAYRVS